MGVEKLRPNAKVIPSRSWNNMADSANEYLRARALGSPGSESPRHIFTDLVDVQNNTGGDRRGGDVVEIDEKLIDDLTNDFLWFGGETPDETRGYGILRKPTPDGKIGQCQVSGVVKAYVKITDPKHRMAKVVSGEHVLESSENGSVSILYPQPGSVTIPEGEESVETECVVLLGLMYPVFAGQATLSENMCGDTCEFALFAGYKWGPFVFEPYPLPTSGINPRKHQGLVGDTIDLFYNRDEEKWQVFDVTKHSHQLNEFRWNGVAQCFQSRQTTVALERCSEVGDWVTEICIGPCSS